jgi:hypothetical protein
MAVRSGEGRRVGEGGGGRDHLTSSPEVVSTGRASYRWVGGERKKRDEVMKGRGVMGI